jgi:integrase/recombinase XerC
MLEMPLTMPPTRTLPPWGPERDCAILELFYSSGMRIAELVALDVGDVDFISETARVMGKGKKERVCPIGGPALTAIQRYRHKAGVHDGPLFLSRLRTRITSQAVDDIVQKYWRASGLPIEVTPHKFRHSFATHLLNKGLICARCRCCSGMRA